MALVGLLASVWIFGGPASLGWIWLRVPLVVWVGDSCLNRYQLALTALCGTHPPSFPTDLFQAEEHVDCGFGGDVLDLHSERCSSSSLSALWLVFFRRQDLATKKQSSRANSNYFTVLLILDGIYVDYMIDNSFLIDFLFWGPLTIIFFQSLSSKIQTHYWY